MSTVRTKKTNKANISFSNVYILATFNNTHITATDAKGNVIAWSTAGACGFKGPRKSTPFAAQKCGAVVAEKLKSYNVSQVVVHVSGSGPGRESGIRPINDSGIHVGKIIDVTPLAHNGCRPPKKRRV